MVFYKPKYSILSPKQRQNFIVHEGQMLCLLDNHYFLAALCINPVL